jgi:hypothetical protein
MRGSNHTPGPWSLKEATASIPVVGANGKTVCSVKFRDNDLDDARLIVAAPEMAEVLAQLLELPYHSTARSVMLRARAILAAIKL